MNRKLSIVISNSTPQREYQYPRTWLVYSQSEHTVKIHIARNVAGEPAVADKNVA
jgi:hypothetical protein